MNMMGHYDFPLTR